MSVVSSVSTNLDGNDDDKLRGSRQTNQSSYNKMLCIGRELCFLLLIVFTAYATFNSNANTGNGPSPTPFFPRGSLVNDFYKGELAEALSRASEGDVSFIMYYAPWDAESQIARRHFEAIAHQHYKQVYFAGINCWQPRGDCKRTLSKIQHFPKLVVYVTHETGVEYRGPLDARYMSAFLDCVMRPLHRLNSSADLMRLRSAYNAVVVAYVNFHGMRGGPAYRAMFEAALKSLERDVRQEVAFAVVTSFKTALEMGVNRTPCIKLYLWNETLDYPGHYVAAPLVEWVSSRLHQVSLWLTPPGVKSLTLAPYVTHGPALVMFTPLENFVMYDLLREVGLEFYNCNNSSDVAELASNVTAYVSRRISQTRRAMSLCQSHAHDLATRVQIVESVWSNSSCGKRPRNSIASVCSAPPQCYSEAAQCSQAGLLARHRNKLTSTLPAQPGQDPHSAAVLTERAWRESCRRLAAPPARPSSVPSPAPLRGLACRYNRSISLLALESSLYGHFARGLGADTEAAKDQTRVFLIDPQMETTHVLSEPITRSSLGQFLLNFTDGRLERFQRTQPPPSPSHAPTTATVTVAVHELTSDTFLPVAFNDTMNVVVFFYTPFCAFCHAVSHVYLTVARLLRVVPSLSFTRLDGENNDLPWQFTAPHYPSILFFPARRKAESRVFAARFGITVDSLTQFVLANLPLELRLVGMLQLCQRFPETQLPGRRRECLVNVRREVLEAISTHLARYRSLSLRLAPSRQKRDALGRLLTRLQRLKQLQLALSVDSQRGLSLPLSGQWLSQQSRPLDPPPAPPTLSRARDEL